MPYIDQKDRRYLKSSIKSLAKKLNINGNKKGELNYSITMLLKSYISDKGMRYDTLSDITGIINDVKSEFERSAVSPYEIEKINQNGGIYEDLFVKKGK